MKPPPTILTFHLDASGRLVGAAGAGSLASVAKDIKIAEKMIAQRLAPDPDVLADPRASLKAVLSVVTVAEAAPRILGRATPESVAAVVADWHAEAGVEIRTAKTLSRISARPVGFEAEFADGDGLVVELVLAGVGALPETRLAEAAGLAIDNGIAADARLRTSDPFVYAAGDCASFPHPLFEERRLRLEAWRNAQDQGSFVAGSLLGGGDVYDAVPPATSCSGQGWRAGGLRRRAGAMLSPSDRPRRRAALPVRQSRLAVASKPVTARPIRRHSGQSCRLRPPLRPKANARPWPRHPLRLRSQAGPPPLRATTPSTGAVARKAHDVPRRLP